MSTSDEGIRIRLLGPVSVTIDGQDLSLSGVRRKTILAMLALHVGRVVSSEWLIEVVWDGSPPATATNTLQAHISALRRIIGSTCPIVARAPGYVLEVPDDTVDFALAGRLIAESARSSDHAANVTRLRRAISLWTGHALADIRTQEWLRGRSFQLDSLRDDATEALIDARLALGEHTQVIPELQQLTDKYPYRENVCRLLMLALYRGGRQADALAAYQQFRRTLADELGIDPAPALSDLETAILRHDAALEVNASAAATVA